MDSPVTPRARYPSSKSRLLSLRRSEKSGIKSPAETENKTVHFHVNFSSPSLKQKNINLDVDVTFSPHKNNNQHLFDSLPIYKTPPSTSKNIVPFNPFNRGLQDRLKSSFLSPSVFSSIKNPQKLAETEFRWSIEDVARIKPAEIEEDTFFEEQIDPETESQAQEAIERFFSDSQLIPSPSPLAGATPKAVAPIAFLKTPCSSLPSAISSTPRRDSLKVIKKTVDACVQTGLSLPPELPEEVEAVLSRYFIQPENSNDDSLSTSSMRRKLFFQCEGEVPSPVKPAQVDFSPVTSGLASSPSFKQYCPSTPIITSRTVGLDTSQLSSPGFSPISCTDQNGSISSNSTIGSRVSVRLNFSAENKENIPMDMSSDNAQDSLMRFKECKSVIENTDHCKMSFSEDTGNANFSLIKVKMDDDDETNSLIKPYPKSTNMEYMNSTSVLMSSENTDMTSNFSQKINSQNFCWQYSTSSKMCTSEDTGYQSQSRSYFNTNSETADWQGCSSDSQQLNDSVSSELPAKRHFSDKHHLEFGSSRNVRKVAFSTPVENMLDDL